MDDEEELLEMFSEYLELHGHECVTAETAEIAYELLKTEPFDLAILDYILPEMNGMDLYVKIETHAKCPRIIFMSGTIDLLDKSIPKKDYVLDWLEKPFPLDFISKIIKANF